jgi:hypothetical protein
MKHNAPRAEAKHRRTDKSAVHRIHKFFAGNFAIMRDLLRGIVMIDVLIALLARAVASGEKG